MDSDFGHSFPTRGATDPIAWPTAVVSIACFLLNAGLLRYLYYIERSRT